MEVPNQTELPCARGTNFVTYFLSTPRDPCHPTLKTSPRELARDAGITSSRVKRSLHMESVGCPGHKLVCTSR